MTAKFARAATLAEALEPVRTVSRPKGTAGTIAVPRAEMWWRSDKPQTLIRKITPDDALKLLDRTKDVNRVLRQAKVDQLARHMIAGTFRPVTEQTDAIAFDTDGRCINGQHRLWAVVESGRTIVFELKIGMALEAIDTIDDHLRRTDADVYAITHEGDTTKTHMAVAMRLLMGAGRPRGGYDRAMKFGALTRFRPFIDKAIELVPSNNTKVRGLGSASMLAVLARASHTVPMERLRRFVDLLHSGTSSGQKEIAAILLRDWMMRNGAGSSILQNELYWKANRALRAFLDGDELTTLYAASGEIFPLPGEILTKPAAAQPRYLEKRRGKRG